MNSQMVVDYLCEVLNIKTDNTLLILDMVEDLKTIQDLAEFKFYIKSRVANLNDEYRYLSGYQKFIKLVDNFNKENKQNLQVGLFDDVEEKINKLIKKCRTAWRTIEAKRPLGFRIDDLDYKVIPKYFDNVEIKLLDQVGGFQRWYKDYDENEFKEELIRIVKASRIKIHDKKLLGGKSQDVNVIKLLKGK